MSREEITAQLEELLDLNRVALRIEISRIKNGKSKSGGSQLVQAVSQRHKILVTLAKIQGYIPEIEVRE